MGFKLSSLCSLLGSTIKVQWWPEAGVSFGKSRSLREWTQETPESLYLELTHHYSVHIAMIKTIWPKHPQCPGNTSHPLQHTLGSRGREKIKDSEWECILWLRAVESLSLKVHHNFHIFGRPQTILLCQEVCWMSYKHHFIDYYPSIQYHREKIYKF